MIGSKLIDWDVNGKRNLIHHQGQDNTDKCTQHTDPYHIIKRAL